jgi:hypothetical protein
VNDGSEVLTSADRLKTTVVRSTGRHIDVEGIGAPDYWQGRLSTQTFASIARGQDIPVRSYVQRDLVPQT